MSAAKRLTLEGRQLHLRIGKEQLPWLVREVTRCSLLGFLGREPTEEELARAEPKVKAFLREVVTGYDLCGLSTLCSEAEEFDPWEEVEALTEP